MGENRVRVHRWLASLLSVAFLLCQIGAARAGSDYDDLTPRHGHGYGHGHHEHGHDHEHGHEHGHER